MARSIVKEMPNRIYMNGELTGSLLFRDKGKHTDGRRLMLVVGLVAVPDDIDIKPEHQYAVMTPPGILRRFSGGEPVLEIQADLSKGIDRNNISGWRFEDVIREKIWPV